MRSIIEIYSSLAKANPAWTSEEEAAFVASVTTDDEKWISSAAKDRFVNEAMKHNIALVFDMVQKLAFNKKDEDIFQIAISAMVEALKKWEPSRKVKISTWINNPVKWAIMQAQNKFIRAGMISDEVSAKTRHHKRKLTVVSIDETVGNDEDAETIGNTITMGNVMPNYAISRQLKTNEEVLDETDIKMGVRELLSTMNGFLNQKESIVICGLLNGQTLADIGVEMKVSRQRVLQISKDAFAKIKRSPIGKRLHALVKVG